METTNGLMRRVSALETRMPADGCATCASRPAITIGGDAAPCGACGRRPSVFTIDIDRSAGREGDAA